MRVHVKPHQAGSIAPYVWRIVIGEQIDADGVREIGGGETGFGDGAAAAVVVLVDGDVDVVRHDNVMMVRYVDLLQQNASQIGGRVVVEEQHILVLGAHEELPKQDVELELLPRRHEGGQRAIGELVHDGVVAAM